MTLIVTMAGPGVALQVADTRLTDPNGALFDDNAYNTLAVRCADTDFSIAFTGLAHLDDRKIDDWLKHRMTAPGSLSFDSTVAFLKDELNAARARNPNVKKHGLTLVLAGLDRMTGQPNIGHVSNYEKPTEQARGEEAPGALRHKFWMLNPATDEFDAHVLKPKHWNFMLFGSDNEMPLESLARSVEGRLPNAKDLASARSLADSTVTTLRALRASPPYDARIGEQCTAVAIARDGSCERYLFPKSGPRETLPDMLHQG